ncbi:LuxR C-terminal-related transcriptional regulator [Streptomyces sp. NPDC055607]
MAGIRTAFAGNHGTVPALDDLVTTGGTRVRSGSGWRAARFVGRSCELDYVLGFLSEIQAHSTGATLLIAGEPGIGKTRFVKEVAARVRRQGVDVAWAQLRPADGKPVLTDLRERVLRTPPCSGGTVGAPRRGVVCVIEDVQHADRQTLTHVVDLVETAQERGAAVLLTCDDSVRSEALDEMRRSSTAPPLHLGELTQAEAEVMMEARFPGLAGRPDVMSALHGWCGGVPLLIEEMADHLTVQDRDDAPSPPHFVPPVPPTVRARTLAQAARLEDAARAVVCAASLLGPGFTWRAVQEVTADRAETVHEALRAASDIGLVVPDPAGGPAGYRFRSRMAAAALCAAAIAHSPADLVVLAANVLTRQAEESFARDDIGHAQQSLEQAWLVLTERPDRQASLRSLFHEVTSRSGDVTTAEQIAGTPVATAAETPSVDPATARTLARLTRLGGAVGTAASQKQVVPTGQHRDAVDESLRAAEEALGTDRADHARRHARTALTHAFDLALPEAACDALDLLGQASLGYDAAGARRAYRRAQRIASAHRLNYWEVRARVGAAEADFLASGVVAPLIALRGTTVRAGLHDLTAQIDLREAWSLLLRGEFQRARKLMDDTARRTRALGLRTLHGHATGLGAAARVLGLSDQDRLRMATVQTDAMTEAHLFLCAHDLPGLGRAMRGMILPEPREDASRANLPLPWHGLRLLVDVAAQDSPAPDAVSVTSSFADRGLALYAKAAGLARVGDRERAADCAREADRLLINADWLRHVGRLCVAESALREAWGEPVTWLRQAVIHFSALGQEHLALVARRLLRGTGEPVPRRGRGESAVPPALAQMGVTSREMDVLQLLSQGMRNKDIAQRLLISPRTVETHVANLFAKTHCPDRHTLGAVVEDSAFAS